MPTKEELTALQKSPLDVKIGLTQNRIREFYRETCGQIYVSFSGGKDSTVVLHIVRDLYPDTKAMFIDSGMEYPEVREFIKSVDNVAWIKPKMRFDEVIEQYGYPVISKDLARNIYYARKGMPSAIRKMNGLRSDGTLSKDYKRNIKYQYLLDAPFRVSDKCCDMLKKNPANRFEKETGLKPILGTTAEESYVRQTAWMRHGCNNYSKHRTTSQPLSFWTEQDILLYIKTTGIPFLNLYGDIIETENKTLKTTGIQRTGCFGCMFGLHREKEPNRFQVMKQTHPKIHEYIVNTLGCGEVLDYIGIIW